MRRLALLLIIPALLLAACGGEAPSADDIATIVAATLEAAAPAATDAPAVSTGAIAGQLSYPSEGIPPLNVVAFDVNSDQWFMVVTELNQTTFEISGLPPGSYYLVAYLTDSDYGGGYTPAVPCGLSVDCTDHSLLPLLVTAGATTEADPADWYAPEGAYPPNPAKPETEGGVGSLSGTLAYPSSFIPAMNVVAFDTDSSAWFYVVTQQNQQSYQIDGLPTGSYYVVAYPVGDANYGGGYTVAVPCGLSVVCTDHSLLPAVVTAGQVTLEVDPQDFYADPGAFPTSPVP
jgi:hypothetical protein